MLEPKSDTQRELDRNLGNEVVPKTNDSNSTTTTTTVEATARLKHLEGELKRVRDEFNQQRAKMKELYLAKEAECKRFAKEVAACRKELDEAKAQLMVMEYSKEQDLEDQNRRAQEEIQTLQQLVQETVDESAISQAEVRRLGEENDRMRTEQQELKDALAAAQQDSPGLAPVLNQAKKIMRKLGAADASSNDNLEDSMRKAQEDAEVLRSLVVPLEEEIKTLKEKLRHAYEELEKHRGEDAKKPPESALVGMLKEAAGKDAPPSASGTEPPPSAEASAVPCDMCSNYETKLVQCQEQINGEKQKALQLEKSIERMREELSKEGAMRADLEAQWQQKREEHKSEVQRLNEQTAKAEQELGKLRKGYAQLKQSVNDELQKLTEEREQVYRHLDVLQKDNEFLSGKYLDNSEMLKDQEINLPQNIDELHELVLTLHENLIVTKAGCEFAERKTLSMQDEVTLLRDQQHSRERDLRRIERDYSNKISQLEEQLKQQYQHHQRLAIHKEDLERADVESKRQISDLRMQTINLQAVNEKLDKQSADLKAKMSVLQEDLANNEAVQKDFVKLSQSLQMQLEKIRSADTQVRWQDEDDVDQCPNCRKEFTVTRRKQHCRHCGTIYCQPCLGKTVPSGPNRRPARVCDVCHTLLVQDTAPYFSREPPQSP
ncbi:rab GTPase-binding effector protein 1 isoform X2 [Toxorhynchites rutilus septentrionalis]|uniref:rab GTPase-binding effector protein 1 isoform X2 n=1 Tax=Toxorhynchites rutilus septentrionalis TaxID=329112 RepID=UPI00247961B1|nr:rab GTPase-binding effector protein 1 isoform X2 [Toxorhynchites rutilus septentrionalis]